MTSEWKMAPLVASLEMQNAGWREADRQGLDLESVEMQPIYQAMLAEAPQPPVLGGEPEVVGYRQSRPVVLLGAHRAHVATLSAEIVRLKAASDANFANVQKVAQERDRVSEHRAEVIAERDTLLAEIERLKGRELGIKEEVFDIVCKERDTLKAELTKAQEFLVHTKKCLSRNKEYAPLSQQELDGLIGHSPSASCRNECGCLWCSQSAPAAKEGALQMEKDGTETFIPAAKNGAQ